MGSKEEKKVCNVSRKDLVEKLAKEFDEIHEVIMDIADLDKTKSEDVKNLVSAQLSLHDRIVKELRSFSGESAYLF